MSNTEKLMRKYPMLSAAWDECSMIWLGIEQNGTVHKFNRKAMRKIVKSEQGVAVLFRCEETTKEARPITLSEACGQIHTSRSRRRIYIQF